MSWVDAWELPQQESCWCHVILFWHSFFRILIAWRTRSFPFRAYRQWAIIIYNFQCGTSLSSQAGYRLWNLPHYHLLRFLFLLTSWFFYELRAGCGYAMIDFAMPRLAYSVVGCLSHLCSCHACVVCCIVRVYESSNCGCSVGSHHSLRHGRSGYTDFDFGTAFLCTNLHVTYSILIPPSSPKLVCLQPL